MLDAARLRDVVYGAAVGDALGVPFEFRDRDTFTCEGMTDGSAHDVPKGTFSDDTSLLIATCDSIRVSGGRVVVEDMRKRFRSWLFHGSYTADGYVFDVGNATAETSIKDTAPITNTRTATARSCVSRPLPSRRQGMKRSDRFLP